jgi:hypothetical protein
MNKGDKVNKLTFINYTEPKIRKNGAKRVRAIFRCDCGNINEYDFSSVKRGHSSRCISCARTAQGTTVTKHGLIKHPLYGKWQDMKNRCRNPNVEHYKSYGARGVKVCSDWISDFKTFYDWCIVNNYKDGLELDRIDVNGNYEPNNCRFVTRKEQGFNKRNTFYISVDNKKYSLAKLMYKNNMSQKYITVYTGLKRGKNIEYYLKKYNIELYDK